MLPILRLHRCGGRSAERLDCLAVYHAHGCGRAGPGTLTIWLLRHAESEWNAAGRWQGHGDPPLSFAGRTAAAARAESVAQRVAAGRPLALFSSDLRRAIETAEFVARVLDIQVSPLADLRELDVGAWTGLKREEIEAKDPDTLAAFETEDPDVRPGGAESRGEIRVRARTAVEALASRNPDADLVLVVHLGFMRALVPGAEPDHLDLLATDLEAIRRARPLAVGPE
ncbi:MAG: histidine phosphatase family protein [Myxococcota bacterium]|nr:histidine phosphatase family protein [Myxococcota bacterium]